MRRSYSGPAASRSGYSACVSGPPMTAVLGRVAGVHGREGPFGMLEALPPSRRKTGAEPAAGEQVNRFFVVQLSDQVGETPPGGCIQEQAQVLVERRDRCRCGASGKRFNNGLLCLRQEFVGAGERFDLVLADDRGRPRRCNPVRDTRRPDVMDTGLQMSVGSFVDQTPVRGDQVRSRRLGAREVETIIDRVMDTEGDLRGALDEITVGIKRQNVGQIGKFLAVGLGRRECLLAGPFSRSYWRIRRAGVRAHTAGCGG